MSLDLLKAQALVPDWIQPLLVQGKITTDILDVLRLQQRVLSICVGSTDLPSAYLTSKPLRQVMYGLLLPAWGSNMPLKVTETDRVGLKLGDIPITPIFTITSKHLQLNSLHKVTTSSGDLYHFESDLTLRAKTFTCFPIV